MAVPHIVLFSGGSACRTINLALCKRAVRLTRIVPAWDSGGSSKVLRETFDMLPVGDIRQALMTMAHGEGRVGDVVKICNARLSDLGELADLRAEFGWFADGHHPLLQRMPADMRVAILNYLNLFRGNLPPDFDLRNGSIGNFILTGAYLANGRDINRAVGVFRDLCRIAGEVWPASVQDEVQLGAVLRNGSQLTRQHEITRLAGADAVAGIAAIDLTARGAAVEPNAAALAAIASADVIVFGPGSFYTSILPHLQVRQVASALAAKASVPRIFVGNILECAETRSRTLAELCATFQENFAAHGGVGNGLTEVWANAELFPFEKAVGKFPYVKHGELDGWCRANGVKSVVGDFEDAWTRGQHDGEAIADKLVHAV